MVSAPEQVVRAALERIQETSVVQHQIRGLWSQTKDLFLCRRVYLTGPPTAQADESRCPTDLAQKVVDVHHRPHW